LVAPDTEAAFEDIHNRIETEQALAIVRQQMKKLDKQQEEVIQDYYFSGLTLPEVAANSGVNIKTAKQIKSAGLLRLRRFPVMRKLRKELYADEHTNFFLHICVTSFQSGSGSAVELLTERRDELLNDLN